MEKYNYTYRLDLNADQIEHLQKMLEASTFDDSKSLYSLNEIKEIVNNPKKIKKSYKKHVAAEKATEARTAEAKKKIQNAINILRMENKKITYYSIAKVAGVSYSTVKKYISLDEIK